MSAKKHLFEKVFEKAKADCGNCSKNAISKCLEDIFSEDYGYRITSKTFSRYYDYFLKDEIEKKNISVEKLNRLAKYIGYENFSIFNLQFTQRIIKEKENKEFENRSVEIHDPPEKKFNENFLEIEHSSEKNIVREKIKLSNNKILTGSGIATTLIAGGLFFNSIDFNSSCMVWKENHYEEIDCDNTSPQMNAVPYNETIFQLKKITQVDTLNFENAINKVWYIKNNGEIEFYTNYGLHPESGKTLKPITKYILNKYVLTKEQ
ncbi:hypothetical protein F0358_16805 [Empedobacter brevis]|uniref:hypothetical protein n=1 Tax=Empedobacter brevis TaxID=247 RepID=UPI00123D49F3|nr:hypothetical protein [Empedobacter brevis]QES94258.1 hypothetical protein F0358_16805 [Empedobacter brevis]